MSSFSDSQADYAEQSIPELVELLKHSDSHTREEAVQALPSIQNICSLLNTR